MSTPDANDVTDAIAKNAAGPKSASNETGSATQHSLDEQIRAANYLKSNNAAKQPHGGLRFVQLIPPGASGC